MYVVNGEEDDKYSNNIVEACCLRHEWYCAATTQNYKEGPFILHFCNLLTIHLMETSSSVNTNYLDDNKLPFSISDSFHYRLFK